MLRNYLRVAVRNIVRHKPYTFINAAGQAIRAALANPAKALRYE